MRKTIRLNCQNEQGKENERFKRRKRRIFCRRDKKRVSSTDVPISSGDEPESSVAVWELSL